MAPNINPIALRAVSDHEVHLFYETDHGEGSLTYGAGPVTTPVELARDRRPSRGTRRAAPGSPPERPILPPVAPTRLRAALGARYSSNRLFEPVGDLGAGREFHRHLSDLASGRRPDLLKIFGLSETAKRLFAKGDLYAAETPVQERKRHRLLLALSKSASARVEQAGGPRRHYRIVIEDATAFVFHTQNGYTQVQVRFQPDEGGPLAVIELQELQAAIGHVHRLHWVAEDEGIGEDREGITLQDLIRTVVLGHKAPEAARDRVVTYTYVRMDEPVARHDADRYATYLARHYTGDYSLVSDHAGAWIVRHFDTVGHVMSLEGACTIVAPTAERPVLPEFLNRFKENTFRKHYVPLMLLALHEHSFLVDRISHSVMFKERDDVTESTLGKLADLRRDSLVFRLLYRFSQVSYIAMHNAVNSALREAFRLDTMLNELCQDIAEGEAFFRVLHERRRAENDRELAEVEHNRHRRYYFTSVLGAAALSGLTVFTIVKEGAEVFHARESGGLFGFWAGIVVSLLACIFGYFKRPGQYVHATHAGEAHDEFTMHAALEQMLHAANKLTE